MSDLIRVERGGPARWIRLGSGDGNFLDLPAIQALTDAVSDPATDAERLIILEGYGAHFSCGRAPGGGFGADIDSLTLAAKVAKPILALYAAVRSCRLPVVAAVRGRALGLGCALAVSCDLTWAQAGSTFSLPELDKDLPPTLALTALVPRVGAKAAAELVFSRREIGAEEARMIGICARVLERDDLDAELNLLQQRMAGNSLRSLATVKAYLATTAFGAQEQMSDIAAELISASLAENLKDRRG
ncbi:enoyl-CoA hydratase/isomerase family protein [Microbaculum marinum]|uniref:Enoyl-CoA hydratase/isomerase family protein n=1 Tax=Microbaculum marinum TaxID=1764581 RepID=A0AAW9RPJ6_9HYPH